MKRSHGHRFLITAIVFGLFLLDFLAPARGQETEPADIEVVVSATRTERKAAEAPGSVSVIGRSEMDRQNVQQLTDLVRYEPDVSVPFAAGGTGPVSRSRTRWS